MGKRNGMVCISLNPFRRNLFPARNWNAGLLHSGVIGLRGFIDSTRADGRSQPIRVFELSHVGYLHIDRNPPFRIHGRNAVCEWHRGKSI